MRQPFVHEMFEQVAAERPTAPALVSAGRQIRYAELDAWSNNIGNYLLQSGIQPEAKVYVAAETCFAAVPSILGVLKIGAIFVPIDPHQPEGRLRALLERVPPAAILTERRVLPLLASKLGGSAPVVPVDQDEPGEGFPAFTPVNTEGGIENGSAAPSLVSEPDDMCYIYFTSGSTGRPKAIAGRMKAIDHFVRWEAETFDVKPGTRVSQLTSLVFDAFLRDAFTPLCVGGTLCVPDSPEDVLDPKRLIRWLDEARVEIVHCVPSLFRTMLAEELKPELFPALRYVLMAGEPLLPADVQRWRQVFGDRIRLVNLYGPTETTMVKLFHIVQPEDAAGRSIPVGRPMAGAKALVLDEAGRPAQLGEMGEIYIRTDYRSLGYYNEPQLTDQVFVANPMTRNPKDIVYRTGDLGRRLDDGSIEFLGRKDQQVKIRGVRVELAEVESAILATGLAAEAVAVSRSDRLGNSYLCAYVVSDPELSIAKLRQAVAEVLPDSMVPSTFVKLDRLPRTSTGKIDRKALPAPEQTRAQGVDPIAPRTEMEGEVARLFAEVLGLEKVGVNEEFFQLGGHSLLAMGLISRLAARFDVDVPLATLFECPTVEQLSRNIEERRAPGAHLGKEPHLAPVRGGGEGSQPAKVQQMSEAEVDSLLADVLGSKAS